MFHILDARLIWCRLLEKEAISDRVQSIKGQVINLNDWCWLKEGDDTDLKDRLFRLFLLDRLLT